MNRLRQLFGEERGFALVLALGVTVVFSMTVVTVIESATSNSRSADNSKNRVSAYTLAEAGISDANAILAGKNPYDSHLLHPQAPYQLADCANPPANPTGFALLGNTCSPMLFPLDGGTATVWGWFDSSTSNWTITSTGQVTRNAFGSQPATKTLKVVVHIRARPAQQNTAPAWNYVFVKDTTPNICNVTLDNSVALTASLYIEGNLCFKNTSAITETNSLDPVTLEVRGKLVWLTGASKGIGDTSVNPNPMISSAKIGGGCALTAVTNAAHVCTPPSAGSDYFYVKAGGYSQTADPITSVNVSTADWDTYYQNAMMSRHNPCLSGGLAGTAFDNDTTRNNSLPTTFNLTPSTNYTCQTKNANGFVIGELDWNASTRILNVRGTAFIDGNVTIDGVVKYRGVDKNGNHPSGSNGSDGTGGMIVLYVSGTVSLSNSGVFCGWNSTNDTTAYNSGTNSCDFSAWTPQNSMFMFVAGGGVTLNQSSFFQGAIYSDGNVSLGQSSQIEGPIITNTLTVGNSVKMKPLPGLADLPLGAPGNPNSSGVPEQPYYSTG